MSGIGSWSWSSQWSRRGAVLWRISWLGARTGLLRSTRSPQPFNKLLDDEYDSNFPGTFASCWKEIISEVGKKVSGVNLDSFLIPSIPIAEGSPVAAASEVQPSFSVAASSGPILVLVSSCCCLRSSVPRLPLEL